MHKLTKARMAELRALRADADSAYASLEDAVVAYNNSVLSLSEFCTSVADDIETYMDERSDAWQEGVRAEEFREVLDAWQGVVLYEVDMPDPAHEVLDDLPLEW